MKKICMLVLTLMTACLVASCGKSGNAGNVKNERTEKEFEIAEEAYEEIDDAYAIVDEYASDIYNAWNVGIYDEDEMSIELLADETGLGEADLRKAFNQVHDSMFEDINESTVFYLFAESDDYSVFQLCVDLVRETYKITGKEKKAKQHLEEAKKLMKQMSKEYSDYEHYENLKGYYTKTNAFFEFCAEPAGSFEQMTTTVNDYRNQIRDFQNDLSYIFED